MKDGAEPSTAPKCELSGFRHLTGREEMTNAAVPGTVAHRSATSDLTGRAGPENDETDCITGCGKNHFSVVLVDRNAAGESVPDPFHYHRAPSLAIGGPQVADIRIFHSCIYSLVELLFLSIRLIAWSKYANWEIDNHPVIPDDFTIALRINVIRTYANPQTLP